MISSLIPKEHCAEFSSTDGGKTWTMFANSTDVPGSPNVSLWASGSGEVTFRNFQYRGLN